MKWPFIGTQLVKQMGTVTNSLGRLFFTFIMTSVLLLITLLPKMELKKANYEKIKGSLYTASL
jgi:hypothetical protein